jgi:hypothetical protein
MTCAARWLRSGNSHLKPLTRCDQLHTAIIWETFGLKTVQGGNHKTMGRDTRTQIRYRRLVSQEARHHEQAPHSLSYISGVVDCAVAEAPA